MHDGLRSRFQQTRQQMRVSVARHQNNLKENHASRPDARTATKPRQNVLGDEWLNLEKQKCAKKRSNRKRSHDLTGTSGVGRFVKIRRGNAPGCPSAAFSAATELAVDSIRRMPPAERGRGRRKRGIP